LISIDLERKKMISVNNKLKITKISNRNQKMLYKASTTTGGARKLLLWRLYDKHNLKQK
jgi:hypothetical protein